MYVYVRRVYRLTTFRRLVSSLLNISEHSRVPSCAGVFKASISFGVVVFFQSGILLAVLNFDASFTSTCNKDVSFLKAYSAFHLYAPVSLTFESFSAVRTRRTKSFQSAINLISEGLETNSAFKSSFIA
ncbi:hypothetical protein P5673_019209 [Acropora cervicornis]|uniref:Uncharacterized protein n=1 Tax=Acropora cervicornis TaxID=6130 RepID=A0AAD9QC28_ACRCE|nr:hypothetical protein P5673_019209 [Acropora cervicornis]